MFHDVAMKYVFKKFGSVLSYIVIGYFSKEKNLFFN